MILNDCIHVEINDNLINIIIKQRYIQLFSLYFYNIKIYYIIIFIYNIQYLYIYMHIYIYLLLLILMIY